MRNAAEVGDGTEWDQDDGRVDPPWARLADPLATLVAREALHRRLLRAGVIVFAIVALIALVSWAIGVADNVSFEAIFTGDS